MCWKSLFCKRFAIRHLIRLSSHTETALFAISYDLRICDHIATKLKGQLKRSEKYLYISLHLCRKEQ